MIVVKINEQQYQVIKKLIDRKQQIHKAIREGKFTEIQQNFTK